MQLLAIATTHDHKHRPHQTVVVVATGTDKQKLLAEMDKDVQRWQQEELNDAEIGEDGFVSSIWRIENERWEMDRSSPEDLRKFAWNFGDGGSTSICYHILE